MRSLVVLFALASMACGSLLPLAQPPHHPAVVLDPHGRPLDTAEVIGARALHLQAKALEHHVPLVAAPVITAHAAPLLGAHSLLGHSALGLAGHGHLLKKRSLAHISLAHAAPAAVSHQARVDVISNPVVLSHAIAAPVVSHAVAAPVVAHAIAPSAVSHQSRVDIRTSPAVIAHSVVAAPVHSAHSILAAPLLSAHAGLGLAHGHLLKKRSLGHILPSVAHIAPAAVSHQARLDVISSPSLVSHAVAAPLIAHAAPVIAHAAPAVSHQSRVDVISSGAHLAPVAHSSVWTAPASHLSHSGLLHSAHLVHGW